MTSTVLTAEGSQKVDCEARPKYGGPVRGAKAIMGLALATVALASSQTASATAAPIRLRLPGPGQTTLGVVQMRYPGKAPRNFDLRLANRSRFGPSYRGLYATYARRHGSGTLVTFVTLVLRKQGRTAKRSRASAAASMADDRNRLSLYFLAGGRQDGTVEDEMPMRTRWGPPVRRRAGVVYGSGAPTKTPSSLTGLFREGGVDTADGGSDGVKDAIDTGHYDDGHAFGWKSAGTKKALGDWLHLSANNEPYEELIERIEFDIHADLDGDGEIGGGSGGGIKIETEVGPPQIK